MADAVDHTAYQTAGYLEEPPAVMAGNLSVGVRLFVAAMVSFFGAFLFAYVYLRERDAHSVWRPAGVTVPLATGTAIFGCIVLSALVTGLAVAAIETRGEPVWRLLAGISQLLTLAALGIQCYQWSVLAFGPGSGAYASVFIAWTGFYAGFGLTTALYWRQTMLSSSLRQRGRAPGAVSAVAGAPSDPEVSPFRAVVVAEARSFALYWYFLAGVEVVTFVLLYLVR